MTPRGPERSEGAERRERLGVGPEHDTARPVPRSRAEARSGGAQTRHREAPSVSEGAEAPCEWGWGPIRTEKK